MERFQTFNLGNAIAAGQRLRANRMKLDAAQTAADRTANLKSLAQQSTKPTYDKQDFDMEGPNKPSGTEYSGEKHVSKLRAAGETEEAAGLERHLAAMSVEKRKQTQFDAEQGAITAYNAKTPEEWETMQDGLEKQAAMDGKPFYRRTYGERPDVITQGMGIAGVDVDGSTKGKKAKQKLNAFWKGLTSPVKTVFDPNDGSFQYEKTPGNWVDVPANAQIVSTSIQGSSKDVLGLTKTNITELNRKYDSEVVSIDAISKVLTGLDKNPNAVGARGALAEISAGLAGQFGEVGQEIASLIESDDEIEVRTGIRMLTGKLIPSILNDDSGRYSDKDMERVDEINRGMKLLTNVRQTRIALETVLEVLKAGHEVTKSRLGKTKSGSRKGMKPSKSKFSYLWDKPKGSGE